MATINVNDNINTAIEQFEVKDFFKVDDRELTYIPEASNLFGDMNSILGDLENIISDFLNSLDLDMDFDLNSLYESLTSLLDNVMSEFGLPLGLRSLLLSIIDAVCKGMESKQITPLQALILALIFSGEFCEGNSLSLKDLQTLFLRSLGVEDLYNDVNLILTLIEETPRSFHDSNSLGIRMEAESNVEQIAIKNNYTDVKNTLDDIVSIRNEIKHVENVLLTVLTGGDVPEDIKQTVESLPIKRVELEDMFITLEEVVSTTNDTTLIESHGELVVALEVEQVTLNEETELRDKALDMINDFMVLLDESNVKVVGVVTTSLILMETKPNTLNMLSMMIEELQAPFILPYVKNRATDITNLLTTKITTVLEITRMPHMDDIVDFYSMFRDVGEDVIECNDNFNRKEITKLMNFILVLNTFEENNLHEISYEKFYGLKLFNKSCKNTFDLGFTEDTNERTFTGKDLMCL